MWSIKAGRLPLGAPSDAAVLAALAAPHVLYAAVWLHAPRWRAAFGKAAVPALEAAACVGKVLQFWAAAAWWTSRGGSLSPAGTPAPVLAAGALLLTIGQTLNVAVYRALGGDGVYYGARLGRVVPWVHGFPFTLGGKGRARRGGVRIPHPQYLGSAATAWGLFLLFSANAPAGGAVLIAYWTALYVVTGVQEDYL